MPSLQSTVLPQAPPSAEQAIAARVNGKTITYEDLDAEFRARTRVSFETVQDDPRAQSARKQLLDHLIDEELLLVEAERQKLRVTAEMVDERVEGIRRRFPSEEAFNQAVSASGLTPMKLKENIRKGMLRQQIIDQEILQKISVSPEESQAFFQEHKDEYVQEETVHARHILFRVAEDASPEDDQKAKTRANAVLAKAKKGEDFATLAQEYSEGPTKDKGGDLGYFGRGKMLKPFEDAAFQLKVGEVSDLVRTRFGYHIIKVEDRKAAKRLSYDEAKDQVKQRVTEERATALYRDYIAALRGKATVTVNLK
jgi:peptidyl-prolyl cis-trans isomerase C